MTFPLALLALLAAAAFGAICAAAGALWMRARAGRALRAAIREREQLLDLAQAWIWRTDADLRITQWRPPAQRASAWREVAPLGERLTDIALPVGACATHATCHHAPGQAADLPLARQAHERAPIAAQRVALRLARETRTWLLRGQPCHDDDGRFTGYVGSALPT
jgi:PAS domain-containing protein